MKRRALTSVPPRSASAPPRSTGSPLGSLATTFAPTPKWCVLPAFPTDPARTAGATTLTAASTKRTAAPSATVTTCACASPRGSNPRPRLWSKPPPRSPPLRHQPPLQRLHRPPHQTHHQPARPLPSCHSSRRSARTCLELDARRSLTGFRRVNRARPFAPGSG